MRILRTAGHRSMPWKNGGGVTTEIIVSPAGAGLDHFDWRVSMARVEASGPFSQFSGIDRTLAVLEGKGIVLEIAGRPPMTVDLTTPPLSFPADVPTAATLIDGPIADLNVMSRRGRVTHSVERIAVTTPARIRTETATTLVLCVSGGVIIAGAEPISLGPLDALLTAPDIDGLSIQPTRRTVLFVVRIDAVPGND
ncbi:HutD family protein [Mesorhizobium sp. ES1-1]|uniref:HutD/Ves family protein n=1 Tax=Mesorhizobium sp. ES1-1 TaxID=2876629 RepID=UPI001CCC2043|nr:HutD family protein [Mesorhizobium sp. ES1-1]MBZ9675100.1 HutD family protein [Mesorhizobium sp. ES1-1]